MKRMNKDTCADASIFRAADVLFFPKQWTARPSSLFKYSGRRRVLL